MSKKCQSATPATSAKVITATDKQKPSVWFQQCFDRLMEHEGGYVNDSRDRGGETMWGVTKQVARKYGYKGSMRKLPKTTACDIAYQKYWHKVKADKLEDMGKSALAWQVFDAGYNHGNGNAIRFLQRACGVVDDGVIGKVTLKAVQDRESYALILAFNAERLAFYTKLKSFKTFGRGWSRRVVGNLTYAIKDLTAEKAEEVTHD